MIVARLGTEIKRLFIKTGFDSGRLLFGRKGDILDALKEVRNL